MTDRIYNVLCKLAAAGTSRAAAVTSTSRIYQDNSTAASSTPVAGTPFSLNRAFSPIPGTVVDKAYTRELPSISRGGAMRENVSNMVALATGKDEWSKATKLKYQQNLLMRGQERKDNQLAATGSTENHAWGGPRPAGGAELMYYNATIPYRLPSNNPQKPTVGGVLPPLHTKVTESFVPEPPKNARTRGRTANSNGAMISKGVPLYGETPVQYLRRMALRESIGFHERGHNASFPYLYRDTAENRLLKVHAGLAKLIPGYKRDDRYTKDLRRSGYMFSGLAEALRGFNVYKDAIIADPNFATMPSKLIGDRSGNWAPVYGDKHPLNVANDGENATLKLANIQRHGNQYYADVTAGKRKRDVEIEEALRIMNSLYRGAARREDAPQTTVTQGSPKITT